MDKTHSKYKNAAFLFLLLFILAGCFSNRFAAIKKSPPSYTQLVVQHLNKGVELKHVYMTPSKRYPGNFYIAGEIFGKHMSGTVAGVWIIDGTAPPSRPLSVNQAAIAFSGCTPIDKNMRAARLSSNTEARHLLTFIEGKHYR